MWFLSVPDKSLLALLCSRIGWWLITEFCPRIQNGAQLIWDNFRQIPIPQELPQVLNEYADKMMAVRNDEAEFLRLSKEIDNIIATLYNLTEELNFIINNDTKCRMYDELNVHEYAEKIKEIYNQTKNGKK